MLDTFIKRINQSYFEYGAVNIVCLGDSVTHGYFASSPADHESAYPVKLRKLLDFYFPNQVFNVINSGIGGTTATQALNRFERDVLKFQPDLVLIMFGVNDCNDIPKYLESLDTMFKILNSKNIPAVYITEHMMNTYLADDTLPELINHCKWSAEKQTDGTMDKLFDEGKRIARENNIAICDIYDKWKKLYANGVDITMLLANRTNHPVPEMHTLLANEIINTLLF